MGRRAFAALLILCLLSVFFGCSESPESTQAAFLDTAVRWPKTGLAKNLPEPEFGQIAGVTDAPDKFCAAMVEVSPDDLRDYVALVKKAGFTVDAELSDREYMGIEFYEYSAGNAEGLIFTLSGTAGTCTITLKES